MPLGCVKLITYSCVSTHPQGASGLGLGAQIETRNAYQLFVSFANFIGPAVPRLTHGAGSRPDLHKNESYVSCQSSVTYRSSARRRAITIAPRPLGASCGARWRPIRNSQSSAATVTRKSQAGQSIGSTSRTLRPTSSISTIPGLEDTNLCLDSRT